MSGLCYIGGAIGYARSRSLYSVVAGVTIGSAYALCGMRIQEGMSYGYEGATGELATFRSFCGWHLVSKIYILQERRWLCSEQHSRENWFERTHELVLELTIPGYLPFNRRAIRTRLPVPIVLSVAATATAAYYGKQVKEFSA